MSRFLYLVDPTNIHFQVLINCGRIIRVGKEYFAILTKFIVIRFMSGNKLLEQYRKTEIVLSTTDNDIIIVIK